MATKWIQTKYEGIRYREHATRLFGIRKDRYYVIRYRVNGVRKEEPVGWESQNDQRDKDGARISLVEVARATLARLKDGHRDGQGPATLEEKREQAQAAKAEAEAQAQAENAKNITLSEYWPTYLTSAKILKPDKKDSSWKNEESLFANWIEPVLGDVPLHSIGLQQWEKLMVVVTDARLTPRTRQYVALVLRQCLNHAYTRELISTPPPGAKLVGSTLGENNRRTRSLTDPELQAILAALQERDMNAHSFTLFCALTGCRFGEAASLEWQDVDFSEGQVIFRGTKNKTNRKIPLSDALLAFLQQHRKQQSRIGNYVFLSEAGDRYRHTPKAFRNVVEELQLNEGRAKRDRVVFHTLRHTAASRFAKAGTPLHDLQAMCGWKSPVMALRYQHSDDEDQRNAMNALSQSLLKTNPDKVVNLFEE